MTDYISQIKERISLEFLVNRFGLQVQNGYIKSIFKIDDNTPSMKLYFDSNTYKDYSTGEQGDQIDFYCGYYRVDKKTAIDELCQLAGIDREFKGESERKALETPAKEFHKYFDSSITKSMSDEERYCYDERLGMIWDVERDTLVSENEGFLSRVKWSEQEALKHVKFLRLEKNIEIFEHLYSYCIEKGWNEKIYNYLTEVRKLTPSIIEKFKLFSIDNYFEVNTHMKKAFSLEELQRSGLFNQKGNLLFYSHRLIIPYLWDNNIIYLRGRYFDQDGNYSNVLDSQKTFTRTDGKASHRVSGAHRDVKNFNKYLGLANDKVNVNSPKRLFNSSQLRTMLKDEKLYIVEGEFDAIALEMLGKNAVAVPGVGNLPSSVKLKSLLDKNVVICVDKDSAGNELLERLKKFFWENNKSVKVKQLNYKDVNDLVAA